MPSQVGMGGMRRRLLGPGIYILLAARGTMAEQCAVAMVRRELEISSRKRQVVAGIRNVRLIHRHLHELAKNPLVMHRA